MASCAPTRAAGGADAGEADGAAALPPGVYALSGSEDRLADDFAPLAPEFVAATIIGLGESNHASAGLQAAKARLARYLISDHGVRAVAIESPWTAAMAVGDFISACEGSATEALLGLLPVWRTQELADLLAWICDRNTKNPQDPVVLFGFDSQQPWDDGPRLMEFFAERAPEIAGGIDACDGTDAGSREAYFGSNQQLEPIAPEDHEACTAALEAAAVFLDQEPESQETQRAALSVVSLKAWQRQKRAFHDFDWQAGVAARDRAMATLLEALRGEHADDARTLVWTHDQHAAYAGERWVMPPGVEPSLQAPGTPVNLGQRLREAHGAEYLAIGVTASRLEVGLGSEGGTIEFTGPDQVESELARLGEPALLVDLEAQVLLDPERSYRVGHLTMYPAEQFGALIYLQESANPTPSEGSR